MSRTGSSGKNIFSEIFRDLGGVSNALIESERNKLGNKAIPGNTPGKKPIRFKATPGFFPKFQIIE